MGNERKLSVAESWRLALVDPTHRGEGAVGTVFAEIQSLAGRPVETRTCDRPEPADLALVDVTVVDLTAEMVTPVDLLLDTVTARPHVPVLAVVQKNDPDLASRAEVAGAQVVIRMGEDAEEFREALLTAVRDLLTLGRPVIGGRRGTTGALAQSNPEVFGSLVYRYAREVQARVDLRRGAVTEGHPAPKRSGLSALSAALVELEAGPTRPDRRPHDGTTQPVPRHQRLRTAAARPRRTTGPGGDHGQDRRPLPAPSTVHPPIRRRGR